MPKQLTVTEDHAPIDRGKAAGIARAVGRVVYLGGGAVHRMREYKWVEVLDGKVISEITWIQPRMPHLPNEAADLNSAYGLLQINLLSFWLPHV